MLARPLIQESSSAAEIFRPEASWSRPIRSAAWQSNACLLLVATPEPYQTGKRESREELRVRSLNNVKSSAPDDRAVVLAAHAPLPGAHAEPRYKR